MSFLPASTNADYRGSGLAVAFLGLAAVLTIVPGLIHSFAPDGGAGTIAPPASGHHPPEYYASVVTVVLAAGFLGLSLRVRRSQAGPGASVGMNRGCRRPGLRARLE